MSLLEFIVLAPVSLFAVINPFSTVPAFLAITPGDTAAERIAAARLACVVATGIMLFLALAGQFLFSVLGITLSAVQIAGGALLFVIGFDMIRLPDSPTRLSPEERQLATAKEDIAITPLAVPLLCGPAAISTVIVLQAQAETIGHIVALLAAVPVVYLACYAILRASVYGASWMNPILLRILRRLMGLLFAMIAVQFIINGIGNLPFVLVQ